MNTATLPPVFISHGSPMTALEPRAAGLWWRRLGQRLAAARQRPAVLIVASAHSLSREPVLLAADRHRAVHDFGGFDARLFDMRYDAAGAPAWAEAAAALLRANGMAVQVRPEGGLDHGIWVPLREIFPAADVPVLPLAWPPHWTAGQLFEMGRALAPLVAEGAWIVGSGSITHNLRRVFAGGLQGREDAPATAESTAFRDWFEARGAARDWEALLHWSQGAPHAASMHPSTEHLLPFFVPAGAAAASGPPQARRLHESVTYGELGMDVYAFGPDAATLAEAA
jgi:4,5-DOPA dioxygenase extradiol